MKDANPRIFRSLEKGAGPAEFDTIVAAAVSSYGALRHPTDAQARDFARLVLPIWDRLKPETKRALGASLSHSPNVPRGIVDKLLAEPVETAAPFLVSSPVLTEMDRLLLAKSRDRRMRRIADDGQTLARSAPLPAPEAAAMTEPVTQKSAPSESAKAERTTPSPSIEGSANAALPAAEARPAAAPTQAEPGKAAEAVRDALRRMVRPGARPAPSRMTIAELVETSVLGGTQTTIAALGAMTGLDEASLLAVEQDETGERLAVALKALGCKDADAMTVVMMLKPKVGLDVTAFDLMARYYRALKVDDCLLLIGGRRRVEAPAMQPLYEDLESSERSAPRAAFGRRIERPATPESKARRA